MCKIFIHVRVSHEGLTIIFSSLIKILTHYVQFFTGYKVQKVLVSNNIHL